MKKFSRNIICFFIIIVLSSSYAFAIDTESIPLRETMEKMGMMVSWNDGAISLQKDDLNIICAIDKEQITANERNYKLDKSIYLDGDTSYISTKDVSLISNIILYNSAIVDAILAEEDELKPLKSITTNDMLLVCTWHKYPDSYKNGETITTKYGDVWVFTKDEIEAFDVNSLSKNEMVLRFEQLIGLPPQSNYTHFSYLWVNPVDLFRPTPDNEITDTQAELAFPATASNDYKMWFNGNCIYSYQPHKYPWTKLGYTYDWADNGTEYGLSEFILKKDSIAKVEKTFTNDEFFDYLLSK